MRFRKEIIASLITIKLKDSAWAFYIYEAPRAISALPEWKGCELVISLERKTGSLRLHKFNLTLPYIVVIKLSAVAFQVCSIDNSLRLKRN